LPSLTDVRGGSNVQTTSSNTTICDLFNEAHSAGVIKGVNTCITSKANPDTNASSTGGGSSSTATSTSGSKSDGVTFYPSTLTSTGFGAILAAIFFF